MLWSFPGLLDIDQALAREALEYAFTVQLRNVGTHSRFIDGTVLEDGLELDEAVAPVIALGAYVDRTGDQSVLATYGAALNYVRQVLQPRFDQRLGSLYHPARRSRRIPQTTILHLRQCSGLESDAGDGEVRHVFERTRKLQTRSPLALRRYAKPSSNIASRQGLQEQLT